VKGAAMLDALITVAEAEEMKETASQEAFKAVATAADRVKTAAAAKAVRSLIAAGLMAVGIKKSPKLRSSYQRAWNHRLTGSAALTPPSPLWIALQKGADWCCEAWGGFFEDLG